MLIVYGKRGAEISVVEGRPPRELGQQLPTRMFSRACGAERVSGAREDEVMPLVSGE